MKTDFKNMSKEEKILTIAKYIIINKATIGKTAQEFEISTSSIKKYINNEENLQSIDYNAYLLVKQVQEQLEMNGRINGGKVGKRGSSISSAEIIKIATIMCEKGLTLGQASTYFNIPTSTLYENLMKINDEDLKSKVQTLFDENNNCKGGRR